MCSQARTRELVVGASHRERALLSEANLLLFLIQRRAAARRVRARRCGARGRDRCACRCAQPVGSRAPSRRIEVFHPHTVAGRARVSSRAAGGCLRSRRAVLRHPRPRSAREPSRGARGITFRASHRAVLRRRGGCVPSRAQVLKDLDFLESNRTLALSTGLHMHDRLIYK